MVGVAPYHFDAADLAELRPGRIFVHRSRDPWTDGPVYARVVTWNLDRIAFDEIRRYPGRPDELIRWNMPLEEFFAKALDRWHDSDEPAPPPPPTGGYRLPLDPRRAGRRDDH